MKMFHRQWKALGAGFLTMIVLVAVAAGLAWRASKTPPDQAHSTGAVDDVFYAITRDPRYAPAKAGIDQEHQAKAVRSNQPEPVEVTHGP